MFKVTLLLVLTFLGWTLSGCTYTYPGVTSGVSPDNELSVGAEASKQGVGQTSQAAALNLPEDGSRHRTEDGVDLIYSRSLGVYEVAGMEATYYSNGTYYRREGIYWLTSTNISGPWGLTMTFYLPEGLQEHPFDESTAGE